jgi:hypothetical protein
MTGAGTNATGGSLSWIMISHRFGGFEKALPELGEGLCHA